MSRWRFDDWYPPAPPKRPPPAHGIKVRKTGATWWGQRWIESLERMAAGYANRLARGRTYARAGRTHDLEVLAGKVTARVTGSRPRPYVVTIALKAIDDRAWKHAIGAMTAQARFSAELLSGQMPREIDDCFREAGASLFPAKRDDLVTACSCPDSANPCKHVAATHFVLGEALDKDPFLLFELRGRTKDRVLAELRAARSGSVPAETAPAPETVTRKTRGAKRPVVADDNRDHNTPAAVDLGALEQESYDAWREPPPALHLRMALPDSPGALLRQLGEPPGWSDPASPAQLLAPVVERASKSALAIALNAEGDHSGSAEATPQSPTESRPAGKSRAANTTAASSRNSSGKRRRETRPGWETATDPARK